MSLDEPTDWDQPALSTGRTSKRPLQLWVVLLAMGLGLVGAFLLANIGMFRGPPPRVACAARLAQIGRACMGYAEAHDGHLPASLALLAANDRLDAEKIACPASEREYTYVAGLTLRDDADLVLAYESLSNHGGEGANVLRLDGSVNWLNKNEFRKAMARLMLATSAPASRPVSQPAAEP